MHPPFFVVDHKIGPDIHHCGDHKPVKRRILPERLRLTPSMVSWPPVALLPPPAEDTDAITAPSGAVTVRRPQLQVVPPPRRRLREIVGRWLIRAGQRMILQNRPG